MNMKKMKRIAAMTLAASLLTVPALAAPVNQMANHETAIGANTKGGYIEHKVTGKATLGYEYADRDEYGSDQQDAYLQYDIVGSEAKLIGGYRWNLPGNKDNAFGGVALSTPKVLGFDVYASYIAGKDFNEVQAGLNKNILFNVDLNVNYHNFKPDHGSHENGVGVGLAVKF
jgi:hypothetical protein